MSTAFLISYFALWALFLLQSLAILVLLRQVGVLHLRIRPAGARVMPLGPEIGQQVPRAVVTDIDDPAEPTTHRPGHADGSVPPVRLPSLHGVLFVDARP